MPISSSPEKEVPMHKRLWEKWLTAYFGKPANKTSVLLVAGHIADPPSLYTAGFSGIFSIAPGPVTLEKSMHPEFAATHLQRLITQICKLLQAFRV